ncbi:MAG: 6-bladed beta-propeller, partial [Acidobacteria bacterium]|nr:6-bladed beta-propeller [Acidobacteriota bacterium]
VMTLGKEGIAGETNDTFNQPTNVAVAADDSIFVTDGYGNQRVVKFSKDGKFIRAWGKKGTGEGEFNLPHTVAVDANGRVYVGDRENHRLQVFDSNGKFLAQWKQAGSPFGLDLTPDQRLFLIDGYDERVIVLNLDGQVLGRFGGPGKMPGQFGVGHAIAVGRNAEVYVAEVTNWRAQKFVRK